VTACGSALVLRQAQDEGYCCAVFEILILSLSKDEDFSFQSA